MLESGQELSARFVLVRALRAGGNGSVWLAQDRERGQLVAVKILAERLMQDVAAVAALERECTRVRSLDHPTILPVDGVFRSARHIWVAMEYAAGGDLSALRGRPSVDILRATLPVAGALAYAHRAGVIHRDLKPTNVLLMADGTPRLADFGIALSRAQLPVAGVGRGSPYSMSPQQLDGEAAEPADDIYAFGAMLYELLSGYPPFYPDVTPERVRTEQPAPLPSSVPPAVAKIVEQCLAKQPSDRPANMDSVERELSTILATLPTPTLVKAAAIPAPAGASLRIEPPNVRAPGVGETLQGQWRKSSGATARADDLRRQGFRRGMGTAAVIVGLVAVAGVLFVLPKWVGTQGPARYAPAASKAKPEAPAAEKKEVDFAALARAKQEAEEQRTPIEERLQKLRERAVEQWGGEDYPRVVAEVAAGDKLVEAREYIQATERFAIVEPLLTALEKRAQEVLAEQLKLGATALTEGRSADARTAFELASKIDPKNQVAARGLKRAGTLDQVLELVATAERAEKESSLVAATEAFQKALALDAEAPRAAEGLARVQARISGDAFASAMARGFGALAKADYAGARGAFEAAGKIRPNAPEVTQALKQIEQDQRTVSIEAKLKNARELEANERWADALTEYRAILELDSTVAPAKESAARVSPRADLNAQLELLITQPERLFSQPVRAGARETLGRATSIANPGPVLTRQIATLSDWLKRADVPVQVALQSDNLTQVTLYRVGPLGAFASRSLELAPGSYVFVGTRPGYRDVRREVNVRPGTPLPPVDIRCEDKI